MRRARRSHSLPLHETAMPKLPLNVQRLLLAFTTGLFLACAAHVSAQPGGMSTVVAQ
jgi:hypothetical protein